MLVSKYAVVQHSRCAANRYAEMLGLFMIVGGYMYVGMLHNRNAEANRATGKWLEIRVNGQPNVGNFL